MASPFQAELVEGPLGGTCHEIPPVWASPLPSKLGLPDAYEDGIIHWYSLAPRKGRRGLLGPVYVYTRSTDEIERHSRYG